jgi:hypothetical protein
MNCDTNQLPLSIIRSIETQQRPIRVKALAELLGCSIDSVYRGVRKGTFPFLRINGMILFDPSTLGHYFRRKYPAMAAAIRDSRPVLEN